MDFVNKVAEKTNKIASKTAKGINKLADKAKLEYKINDLRSKLDAYYISMGQLKYSEINGEKVTNEMYDGISEQIKAAEEKIKSLRTELDKLNNFVICAECGSAVKKGSRFCQNCGKKLD